jgi:hypothetical protein
VTSSKISEGALAQLQEYKLDQKFNADFLGFQASAAICDGLDIPMLPFKENDEIATSIELSGAGVLVGWL